MTPEELANLAHLRRARDLIDREYARPLDVAALARVALMSTAHFGCASLGSLSARFTELAGERPTAYRARDHGALASVPGCIARDLTRPSRKAEQDRRNGRGAGS